MSSPTLHFPGADELRRCLCEHPLLKTNFLMDRGITQPVAYLGAKRFANKRHLEEGVKLGRMLMMYDLQIGKDGFTGEPLLDRSQMELPPAVWAQISMATEQALIDCARQSR